MQHSYSIQPSIGPDSFPQYQSWGTEAYNPAFGYTESKRRRWHNEKERFQDIAALNKFGLDPRSKKTIGIITQATGYGFPIDGYTTGFTSKLPPPAYPTIASQIPRSGLNPRIVGTVYDEIAQQGGESPQDYSIGGQQTNMQGNLVNEHGQPLLDQNNRPVGQSSTSALYRTLGSLLGTQQSGYGGIQAIQQQGAQPNANIAFSAARAQDDATNMRLRENAVRAIHTTTAGREMGTGGSRRATAAGVHSGRDFTLLPH